MPAYRSRGDKPPYPAPEGLVWVRTGKNKWRLQTPFGQMTMKLRHQLARQALERQGVLAPGQGRPGAGVYSAPPEETLPTPGQVLTPAPAAAPVISTAPPVQTVQPVAPGVVSYQPILAPVQGETEYFEETGADEGFNDADVYDNYNDPGLEMEDYEETDQLGAVTDYFTWSYWKGKWDEMVATLQARIGRLMGQKAELMRRRRLIDQALSSHPNDPDLIEARKRNDSLMSEQKSLEGDFIKLGEKVSALKPTMKQAPGSSGQQLGILPVLVGLGAVIAAIGLAATLFYREANHADEIEQDGRILDAVLSNKLPASALAQRSSAGGGFFGGLSNVFKGATGLLLIGGALYLYSTRRKGRAA